MFQVLDGGGFLWILIVVVNTLNKCMLLVISGVVFNLGVEQRPDNPLLNKGPALKNFNKTL
jgi:hypothetical protein